MRMKRFRVQNYKKVQDTDWIGCDALTVFVGKNESGKSSVFRGLSKLNPSDGQKYDGLKEFPRRRFTAEFKSKDWPVVTAEFRLTEKDRAELTKLSALLTDVTDVVCSRYYSWKLTVGFLPPPKVPDTSAKTFLALLITLQEQVGSTTGPEGQGEALGVVKGKLLPLLEQKVVEVRSAPTDSQVQEAAVPALIAAITAHLNEAWQKELFKSVVEDLNQFRAQVAQVAQIVVARSWVQEHLPKFVYFDRYDVIDSAIHIPTFIQQLAATPSAPRVRSTRALFQHVGLDLQLLQQLDPTQPNKTAEQLQRLADERAILMSSASNTMTTRFADWWEQRRHKFRYQVDGPSFRVWVSDDLDPSEIELDQRSAGMQYFFSFYLIFLEEAKGEFSNSVLLLDEAGLQLHGTAQEKIVKFLERLSADNQLLYTTHSPFMIDGDHLDRVRVVYEDATDGTTKVSENVWPNDKDSLFPLQAALGYSIAQALFYAKRQLVVEGITDYWLLKAMSQRLGEKGQDSLRSDVVIVPAGGVNHLMPLAAMLHAHEVEIRVLLDGDEPGRRKGKEVKDKLLIESFFVSAYSRSGGLEIEDLFPEDLYLRAVGEAYPGATLTLDATDRTQPSVTKRVSAAFHRTGRGEFEKWRPAKFLAAWIQDKPDLVLGETMEAFSRLFKDVNATWN
jgi:hypothetical protein